jgi:tetratricopeptide (TPR) repeat protein
MTLAAALVIARIARADSSPQPIPEKARQLAERGRVYHDAGDYTDAIAAFQEAYVIAPSPGLLFNLAQAYRLAGDCDDAAWMYQRYLDTNPIGEHRSLAETHLSTVEKCGHGGLRISTAPGATAKVSDPPQASLAASAPPADASDPRRTKELGTYIAIGGGVALAGAAWFALDARDAANTVSSAYQAGGNWSDIADANARGERSATIAKLLGVGGGAAVIAGAVYYGLGYRAEHLQHVAVAPTTRGAAVSMSWRF